MAKVLFILMPKGFKDVEFQTPYDMLKNAGHAIDIAGLAPGDAEGADGAVVTPNLSLKDLTQSDFDTYDALVIPGGPGSTEHLWGNAQVQKVAKYFHSKGKVCGFICHATIVAAESGITKGKKSAVYPTDEAIALVKQHDVEVSDEGCVVLDYEQIVTAQGPKFAKDFGQALVDMLG